MKYVIHATGDRGIRRQISRCSTLGQAERVADFLLDVKPDVVVEVFRGREVVLIATDVDVQKRKNPLSARNTQRAGQKKNQILLSSV